MDDQDGKEYSQKTSQMVGLLDRRRLLVLLIIAGIVLLIVVLALTSPPMSNITIGDFGPAL